MMDWDKLRIFEAVAEAGSFTRAGDHLDLTQSSVSRQVAALEADVGTALFDRHARGLVLTEKGELLFQAARYMRRQLETAQASLTEAKERPSGVLRVSAAMGLGAMWLTNRLSEFLDRFPDVRIELVLTNEELDISMREVDVSIRLRRPVQPDLVQRRLFKVHFHAYASKAYVKRVGAPKTLEELDQHRIIAFSTTHPSLKEVHAFLTDAPDRTTPRTTHLRVNDSMTLRSAILAGAGVGMLSDHTAQGFSDLVPVLTDFEAPSLECYLTFAEEMRSVARLQAFRDFIVEKSQQWNF
jgi:DNA-binding transcriptional LysR family regulator